MQALLVFHGQSAHESLVAHVASSSPVVVAALPNGFDLGALSGLSNLNGFITRQGMMIAYLDNFYLMFWLSMFCFPLMVLLRPTRRNGGSVHVVSE